MAGLRELVPRDGSLFCDRLVRPPDRCDVAIVRPRRRSPHGLLEGRTRICAVVAARFWRRPMTALSPGVQRFPSSHSEHFAVAQGEEDDSEQGEHDTIQDSDRPVDRDVIRCHEENGEDVRKETCCEDGGYGDPPPGRTQILEDGELPSLRLI